MVITYVLSLTITRAVGPETETDVTIADMARWMAGSEAKRELEREVLKTLRRLDGDCDVEVMTVEEVAE